MNNVLDFGVLDVGRLTHTDSATQAHGQAWHAITPEGTRRVDTLAVHAYALSFTLVDI